MRLIHRLFVVAIVFFGFAAAAHARCAPTGKVLFQDQFDEQASSWGSIEHTRVENGAFVIQPPAGYTTANINTLSIYDDVDVCVEFTVDQPTKKGNCGGIIFWGSDYDNYYTFQVSTDGQAAVWRRQKGKWLPQGPARNFAVIRRKNLNEVRVKTEGSRAELYVNGELFKEITGQPPQGGSEIGLIACSPSKTSVAVAFDNFIVSGPGEAVADAGASHAGGSGGGSDACEATDKTLFQDQFDQLAPSWGTSDDYDVQDGKLAIHPPAGFNTATINKASLYDDVDICVEMTVTTASEPNCGGIVFWADDYDNYYSLEVDVGGQASIWRRQKGKWLSQGGWQDFSAINKGANQLNTLRVVTTGNRARFLINGRQFKEFTGQPPQGGSQIGLMACSSDAAAARVELDNFVVSPAGGA
jgi:Domain of Unknown Function (DUF1080)